MTIERVVSTMAKLSKQEQEWMRMLDEATTPQEVLGLSKKLNMKITPENAQIIADAHARIIARRTPQDEPKKGFMELLLEASATEDLTEKEAIYAKIEELEIKKEREALRHSAS